MTKHTTSARLIALEVLIRVAEGNAYSNLILGSILQKENLSQSDRGLVTELVYGTITWQYRLDYVIGNYIKGTLAKLDNWVLILLRLSFYQFLFLERIPNYAVVNEAVDIAKRRGHKGIASFINGVLRNYLRSPDKAKLPNNLGDVKRIALQYSHPEWLVERWVKVYGQKTTEEICIANNQPSKISIRVNRLKTDRDSFLDGLAQNNTIATPSELYPMGIRLEHSGNPVENDFYRGGYYTLQDESSMLVGHLLDPKPGMKVLDACAAPGGKSTHIAELMNNQGDVIANDLHLHKKSLITDQASRLGLTIIHTRIGDALELNEQNVGTFDRILLDAPCTGFGVIRRKPDLKWNKRVSDIKAISYTQYQLLEHVSKLLKPGGKMIYSTCTIEENENQNLMDRFIKEYPQFKLDESFIDDIPNEGIKSKIERAGMLQILPHFWGSDGFFIARLIYA